MKLADDDGQQSQGGTAESTEGQVLGETLGEGAKGTEGGTTSDEDEEVVITIGEAAPPSEEEEQLREAPAWIKETRKVNREQARKIRELEQQLAASSAPTAQATGAALIKPTLADCDYDEDAYDARLIAWQEAKRQADEKERQTADARKATDTAFQTKLTGYNEAKAALKVTDFAESEAVVSGLLSPAQQGVLINCAKAPVHVVAALGKNSAEAKKLASITDLAAFAYALAELESKLTVTTRKAPPPPEKVVRGSAPVAGSADKELERLEAEADKSSDRSKVIAYRRQQRAKA